MQNFSTPRYGDPYGGRPRSFENTTQTNRNSSGMSFDSNMSTGTTQYLNRFEELGRDADQEQYTPMNPAGVERFQGRMINTEKDILPNEIPTDGTFRLFLTNDMTRIYAKTWGRNGLPQTIEYQVVKESPKPTPESILAVVLQNQEVLGRKLDSLMEQTANINMPLSKPQNNSRSNNNQKNNANKQQNIQEVSQNG